MDDKSPLGPCPNLGGQLLRELFTLPGVPEYQCRVRWKGPDDFLLWDNRRLQHYAVADYRKEERHLEHCASLGAVPYLTLRGHSQCMLQEHQYLTSCLLPFDAELSDQ